MPESTECFACKHPLHVGSRCNVDGCVCLTWAAFPMCDFCSTMNLTKGFRYRCQSFELGQTQGIPIPEVPGSERTDSVVHHESVEDWLACPDCSDDIEVGSLENMQARAIANCTALTQIPDRPHLGLENPRRQAANLIREQLLVEWFQFLVNRVGARIPVIFTK